MKGLFINDGVFNLNGEKIQILSGAIHYFRTVPEYWKDRLLKLKQCGLNTVETYIPWNIHEPEEGEFCFSGLCDVESFVRQAAELGLYVIVRPSPFICAEWEGGGLPYWLLKYKGIHLRCSDPLYIEKVEKFFDELYPRLKPLLYANGGPIIAMQLENEYGSFGNDKAYIPALKAMVEKHGLNVFLFTADGYDDHMLTSGPIDGVYAALNFGSKPREAFAAIDKRRPDQPHTCMEFWGGWFEHWGDNKSFREPEDTLQPLREMADAGESFNIYMFHGGTNFGFYNGSNFTDGKIEPTATNYESDGFLTEAGGLTEKYRLLQQHLHGDTTPIPPIPQKAYPAIELTECAPLFENLDVLCAPVTAKWPMTMEELNQDYGFVLYRTKIPAVTQELPLTVSEVRDRALIWTDGHYRGLIDRSTGQVDEITVFAPQTDIQLDILVENLGRINYGPLILDEKGIVGRVSVGLQNLYDYTMYPLSLKDLSGLDYRAATIEDKPTFYKGTLTVEEPQDTFIDLRGFEKGCVFVNGFMIGRYWSKGPYCSLYIPAPLLNNGQNTIEIFELEKADRLTVRFITEQER